MLWVWTCSAVKCRAVNFSASVTLTSSDLFALWLPVSCISQDRQDKSYPESIYPTANGSHHTPVSLACPLTSDLTHFTQSNHYYTTIIINIIILPASANRPWHPEIRAMQLFKARGSGPFTDIVSDSRLMLSEITQMSAAGCLWETDHCSKENFSGKLLGEECPCVNASVFVCCLSKDCRKKEKDRGY